MSACGHTVAGSPRRSPRNRVRVLLVEENEFVRDSLAVLLERAGYGALTVASWEQALECGGPGEWDCLVTDLDLPGLGGLELYARLSFQGRARFPAVFLSPCPPAWLEHGLRGAGWVRLLRKPCTFPSLLAALEQCLAARRES